VNDVAELKQFITVHARAQGIAMSDLTDVLGQVEHDHGAEPGSWVWAWIRAGRQLENQGRPLDACRRYNIARFPYVDGQARQGALDLCLSAFDRWRAGQGIERLELELSGGKVRCLTSGLSTTERRPLLLVMGGIVSVKEQWATVLPQARRLGMAGVVTEMPGVGEHEAVYGPGSGYFLPELIDALTGLADTSRTYAVALSFSGHLALDAATADPRIRGIITAGAPVRSFFTDPASQAGLPRITVDTLAHLARAESGTVLEGLRDMALDGKRLASLGIPVYYLASRRDEIIPAADTELLRAQVADLHLVENDDVHGSPGHVLDTRLWIVRSLLELNDSHRAQRAAISAVLGARALGHRFRTR
jgi:esterase FrsA